jgi:antitoxin component of RelBE/YafQ-DinJ toxin-antitoxin module
MEKAILQIPIDKTLRNKAVKVADSQGFSSLQEVIRLFVGKFATNEVQFNFTEPTIYLSGKNEKRYDKMIKNFEDNENVSESFSDVDLLMDDLRK